MACHVDERRSVLCSGQTAFKIEKSLPEPMDLNQINLPMFKIGKMKVDDLVVLTILYSLIWTFSSPCHVEICL